MQSTAVQNHPRLRFAPIVDLARSVLCGYEARAALPPDWLQAASGDRRIRVEVRALPQILAERSNLPVNCFLWTRLSAAALLDPTAQTALRAQPDLAGVVLCVATDDVADIDAVRDGLAAARDRGASVAVEHAGTAGTSLLDIAALRPQFVRLDSQISSGIERDPRRAAIVSALGTLAGSLDAWLVADGVQRERELGALRELRVPLAAGPVFGGPQEEMLALPVSVVDSLRTAVPAQVDRMGPLAQPATSMSSRPDMTDTAVVVVDHSSRPIEVVVPGSRRRVIVSPALCVQSRDTPRDVALRAVAREKVHRLAPVCLCDDFGRLVGLIAVDSLLEAVARS